MPHKQRTKKTATAKTAQVGTESRPTSTEEPRTQVQHTTGETEKETAAASAISKGKDQRELRKRKGTSMRKREQPELQIPATTETDSESESERETDSLEKSDEDGEDESSSESTKKTLRQIMHALKVIKSNQKVMTQKITNMEAMFDKMTIKSNQKVMTQKITNMEAMFDKMTKKQEKMEKKIIDLDVRMEDMEGRMKKMEDDNDAWTSERKQLVGKIDKLENFSRRNNIKIVGLKEGTEGEDPINFFQKWIPEKLEMGEEPLIEIERVHRALRPRSQDDQNPRSILIRCLRYQDKEKILRAAAQGAKRRKGPLMIAEKPVLFYPDISYNLLKRKKEFNPAKKVLWEKGYKFSMRHPATLIIFLEEGKRFFSDYQDAEVFAQRLPSIR